MKEFNKASGFSLIELLVVFAIIALILGIAIPGFSNYNKNQMLKTAAYELKAVLREAQNASLQGKKEAGCSEDEEGDRTLIGHYVTFAIGQKSYSINVLCDTLLRLSYSVKEVQLSSNGTVSVESIAYYSGLSKVVLDENRSLTVMFKPVNGGVVFIDGSPVINLGEIELDKLEIVLSNGNIDQDHAVVISSSGDIYEKKIEE